jgi:hypothetical protein
MPKKKSKAKPAPKPRPPQAIAPPRAEQSAGPPVVHVPKTDPSAFNPDRPAGKLLQSQTMHLREALIRHLHDVTTLAATDIGALKTEGQVSGYIHKVTALLHPHPGHHPRK